MTKTKFFIITTIFGGMVLGFAFGAADVFSLLTVAEAQTTTACNVKTFIEDGDSNGTNVRAAPDKDSKDQCEW